MRALELNVPPPIVALLILIATGLAAEHGPRLDVPRALRIGALVAGVLGGGGLALAGERGFKRASTTVNPLKPDKATSLVTSGVYRFTRNPMYLGLAIVLCGWAAYLCSPWGLFAPVAFAFYITRYQILPEERVLSAKFGDAYAEYVSRVRRWI